jgi:hypothetical protein
MFKIDEKQDINLIIDEIIVDEEVMSESELIIENDMSDDEMKR